MRRFGAVGIVMIGLWSLVGAVALVSSTFLLWRSESGGSLDVPTVMVNLVALLISAGVGLALIMGRDQLASRWFADTEDRISVEPLDLLRIGLVLTGLVFMLEGAQRAFFSTVNAILQARSFGSGGDYGMGRLDLWSLGLAPVGFGLLRLLIGWLVIYYSAKLAAFLWNLSPRVRMPVAAATVSIPVATCPVCGAGYDPSDYREGVERRCVECHASLDGDDA